MRGCPASSTQSRSPRPCAPAKPPGPVSRSQTSARQEIADCDAKLRQHRAALEAGADPVVVTGWMKETQAKRALAEARLSKPKAVRRRLTEEEISELVANVDSIMQDPKRADRADKADLYSRLQVTLKYYPHVKRVAAEARPASIMYVGACPRGDLNTDR
jgi:site-specific DNA recombinase